MQRLTSFEREALATWRTEMALYTQGDLTASAREHLRWLLDSTSSPGLERSTRRRLEGRPLPPS